jgi:hypothetical protein
MNVPSFASIEAHRRSPQAQCVEYLGDAATRTSSPKPKIVSSPIAPVGDLRRLLVDERGSVTAEVLLWIPIFAELTLLTFDVFWAYWLNAEMWNVAFGAVREVARGNFDVMLGPDASMEMIVRDWVWAQLGAGYAVTYAETTAYHVVTIQADVERMSVFGSLADVLPSVQASVTMAKEP